MSYLTEDKLKKILEIRYPDANIISQYKLGNRRTADYLVENGEDIDWLGDCLYG